MSLTAYQIRAQASQTSQVKPAPGSAGASQASTSDKVQPAPTVIDTSSEAQIAALQAQLAQALGIIATISPTAVAAVEGERTYHSGVPFVKIQVMTGPGICEAYQFKGGKLTTDNPKVIAFMEAAIAAGNTMFSHAPIPEKPTLEDIEMRRDVMGAAVIARDKMVAAGEKVA